MSFSCPYENSTAGENISSGRWTKQEHQRFIEAMNLYGKNWKKVQDHVATRTGAQIRSHAQKFFTRLEREINKENIPDEAPKPVMRKRNLEKEETAIETAKKPKLEVSNRPNESLIEEAKVTGFTEGAEERTVLCEKTSGIENNPLGKIDNPILVLKTILGTVAESVLAFSEEAGPSLNPIARKSSFFSNTLSNLLSATAKGKSQAL